MKWIKSACIALSMYSKIPMPMVEWEEENLKYSMCFFPLVGLIIGICTIGWWNFAQYMGIGRESQAIIGTIIPLLITGGIHMDGYLDTIDANSSYQPKEKKLAILKDPHLGAFAVIYFMIYLLIYLACLLEIKEEKELYLLAGSFVISRAWSGISILNFACAAEHGLCFTFQKAADKKKVNLLLIGILILSYFFLLDISFYLSIGIFAVSIFTFWYYFNMTKKRFGGITGDLAGYFLQICERNILIFIILAKFFLSV